MTAAVLLDIDGVLAPWSQGRPLNADWPDWQMAPHNTSRLHPVFYWSPQMIEELRKVEADFFWFSMNRHEAPGPIAALFDWGAGFSYLPIDLGTVLRNVDRPTTADFKGPALSEWVRTYAQRYSDIVWVDDELSTDGELHEFFIGMSNPLNYVDARVYRLGPQSDLGLRRHHVRALQTLTGRLREIGEGPS